MARKKATFDERFKVLAHNAGFTPQQFELIKEMILESGKGTKVDEALGEAVRSVVAEYLGGYERRYRVKVKATPMVIRTAKTLVSKVGEEMAPLVVRHYLAKDDKFYLLKRHALEFCLPDASALANEVDALDQGQRMVTNGEARNLHRTSEDSSVLRNYVSRKYGEPAC